MASHKTKRLSLDSQNKLWCPNQRCVQMVTISPRTQSQFLRLQRKRMMSRKMRNYQEQQLWRPSMQISQIVRAKKEKRPALQKAKLQHPRTSKKIKRQKRARTIIPKNAVAVVKEVKVRIRRETVLRVEGGGLPVENAAAAEGMGEVAEVTAARVEIEAVTRRGATPVEKDLVIDGGVILERSPGVEEDKK